MLDHFLAAISGGLQGGLKGYSWAKDLERDERLAGEREAARRDQNNARGLDLMLRERSYMDNEAERGRERAEAADRERIYDEWYETLTPEMKQVVRARKVGGISTTADDWKPASQVALERKDKEGQSYLDEELKHTRALELAGARDANQLNRDKELEDIRHKNRLTERSAARGLPVADRDDPALPVGVRTYLASLGEKHGGNYKAAEAEWNAAQREQQSKHPRLDPGKARRYLQDVFGHEPQRESAIDRLWNTGPTSADSGQPGSDSTVVDALKDQEDAVRSAPPRGLEFLASGRAQPTELKEGTGRPTAVPIEVKEAPLRSGLPVETRSPEADADMSEQLTKQARSLIEQFKREADPAKKTALRSQLARVREQLLRAQAKAGGPQ